MARPVIRLDGFDGAWKTTELNRIGERVTTRNANRDIKETLTNSARHGLVSQLNYFKNAVSNVKNVDNYYVVDQDYFVYNPRISSVAPFGPINRNRLGRPGIVSPLYSVFTIDGVDTSFAETFFKTSRWHNFMRMNGDTGARHDRFTIGVDDFFQLPVTVPPTRDEQYAIGRFFEDIDASLQAQQTRLTQLRHLKQSMLTKMFPRDGETEPELRLDGFDGEWQIRSVDELFTFLRTNSLSRAYLTENKTDIHNIHYGDVLNKYGSVLDYESESIPYIADTNNSFLGDFLASGDIIFADAAEDLTVGKCTEVRSIDRESVVSGLHTIAARSSILFAPGFLGHALNAGSFHDQLVPLIQGTKVSSISSNTLRSCYVAYPTFDEQHGIGTYFTKLDQLIDLEDSKLTKLQQLKAAFLQKMFV